MLDSNLPRRDFVGALFGVPAAAAIPSVAHAADLDLIATVDAAIALSDQNNTLALRDDWSNRQMAAAGARYRDLARAACAMPANTPLGRAAKARLIMEQNRGDQDGFKEPDDMLASLLRDVIRGAMA